MAASNRLNAGTISIAEPADPSATGIARASCACPRDVKRPSAPRRRRSVDAPVTCADIDAILATLEERRVLIENLERTCAIQFERIAQMQAQLDHLERRLIRRQVS